MIFSLLTIGLALSPLCFYFSTTDETIRLALCLNGAFFLIVSFLLIPWQYQLFALSSAVIISRLYLK